jgi:hypothetical protein
MHSLDPFAHFLTMQRVVQKKGDTACTKVATDSIKEIQQECDAQQDLIKKARGGSKHCCKSGQTEICSAEKALKASQGKVADCGKKSEKLKVFILPSRCALGCAVCWPSCPL